MMVRRVLDCVAALKMLIVDKNVGRIHGGVSCKEGFQKVAA